MKMLAHTRVRYRNMLSDNFSCILGVTQGESLSPFLLCMYLNNIEEQFMLNNFEGVDLDMLKMFLLLYADDIVILSESKRELQNGKLLLEEYISIRRNIFFSQWHDWIL